MAVLTEGWVLDSLVFIATLLGVFYWYATSTANYFKDRGIPYLRQVPFAGRLELFTMSQYQLSMHLYNCFPNERLFGYFQGRLPTLVVKDPDLVNRIMVKDFAHFHDRGFITVESDAMNKNLFNLKGHSWRNLRQKLIPTFTTGKLKQMFGQLEKCGDNLLGDIEKVSQSGEAVDGRVFVGRFTAEVIGSIAFGLDFSRNNPQGAEFTSKINNIFDTPLSQLIYLFLMLFILPKKIINFFKFQTFPKDLTEYFIGLIKSVKAYRKENQIQRDDYFQLLLTLQEAEQNGTAIMAPVTDNEEDALINQMQYVPTDEKDEPPKRLLTDEGLTAQSFVFLTAGTESVSSTISFVLYHLGKEPAVQARLREEVMTVLANHKEWSYQAVKEMAYMDQVIQETQRLYAIVALSMRECTIPYHVPGSDLVIEKGTLITVPVQGLHLDPKNYPEPEKFNPERFADNNHKPNAVFMPFGDGPRICIAMRFAILEMKVCLAKILANYSVEVNSKTQEPFAYDRKSFFPRPKGGILINFKKISLKPN